MSENKDPTPAAAGGNPSDDREVWQWGMFAHLSAFAGFVFPFGNIIGPLVVWQMKKDLPFVSDQGKEALNFQITVSIAAVVCIFLMIILIGFLLLPLLGIASFVLTIIAGLKANNGEEYRYPIALRFIT